MRLPEIYKIAPVGQALDLSSTVTSDSINMKNYHRATFIITIDTLGTASSVLTVHSGATNAALTSALYFNYAFGGTTIGTATAGSTTSCDVLAATTNANTLTLTYGTYSNYMLIVEVDAASMDIANAEEWLTLQFTNPGTATGNVDIIAILEPRYSGNRSETCLA